MTISSYIKIGLGVLAAIAIGYTIYAVYNYGKDTALNEVRKENERLGTEAENAALDYDACKRAGRVWNWSRNKCGGPAANSGH